MVILNQMQNIIQAVKYDEYNFRNGLLTPEPGKIRKAWLLR